MNDDEHYLVRVGYQRDMLPIKARTGFLSRGDEVLCRTIRGVEWAEVLSNTNPDYLPNSSTAKFIRKTRPEDQLLWRKLKSLSKEAGSECQAFLQAKGLPDVLIEVEPLIDGRTLVFHFLGDPSTEADAYVQELSSVYQNKVASSRFAKLLETGCGPGCGTKEKSSCGTGEGCAVCALGGGCAAK